MIPRLGANERVTAYIDAMLDRVQASGGRPTHVILSEDVYQALHQDLTDQDAKSHATAPIRRVNRVRGLYVIRERIALSIGLPVPEKGAAVVVKCSWLRGAQH